MKFFPEVAAFLSVISLCAAATGTKVKLDQGVVKDIYQNGHASNYLYADDLTGCVVFAANWAEITTRPEGPYKQALFVHVCQATLDTSDKLEKFMTDHSKGTDKTSIHDWLEEIIGIDGQPEQAFLVSRAGSDPKYNENMITYLKDNFKITTPNELTYVGKKHATVLQDPWDTPAVSVPVTGQ
jgi:hypothetical protein